MKVQLTIIGYILYWILWCGTTSVSAQSCTNSRYLNDNLFTSTRTDNIYYGSGPSYPANASQDLYFDLYEPVGDTLTKRPLIVMAFGGSFLGGSKRQAELVDFCEAMTRRGYVVASIDYRLGFNFFSTNSATRAVYRAVQDMKGAIRFLKANAITYKIDTNLIYAGGNSAGGITALHAAYVEEDERASSSLLSSTYNSPDLGCGECGANNLNAPPDNLYGTPTKGVISLWGAIGDTIWMEPGDVPVISFHSQGDNTVNFGYDHPYGFPIFPELYGSSLVHQRATNLGIDNEFYPYPGSTHEIWNNGSDALFIQNTTADFMYNCMKPAPPIIAGNNTTCPNGVETYSVPITTGSLYCWTITGGTIISADPMANTIDVQWGTTNGTLEVREINCNVIESDLSAVFNVSISTLSSPTALTSNNINTTTADVSWATVSGATTYNLQYRPIGSSTWTSVSALTTNLSNLNGLTSCTDYEFQVEALCGNSSSGYSAIETFSTIPTLPTTLTTANVTENSADLNWVNNGGTATYDVQYRPVGSSTWTSITGLSSTTTTVSGLTACTDYEFQVAASCSGGVSGYTASQTFSTMASVPTTLTTANVTENSADLNWVNNGGTATYDVQYRPVGSSTWTSITGLSSTTTTVSGLTACTDYEFQVNASCSGGVSGYTASQIFSTTASVPTTLTTANVTENSVDLNWVNTGGTATYDVQYRPVGSSTWTSITGLSSTTTTVSGLTACTDYEFQVNASCSGGVSGYTASQIFSTTASVPTTLTTANVTENSVDLNWVNTGGTATYDVQYRPVGSSTWTSITGLSSTTTTVSGLTACTDYEFQVAASCSGGVSGYTASQTFSTMASVPTTLTTANVTENSADLNWVNNGGTATYDVQYRPVGSSTWTSITGLSSTTTTVSGLTACTDYEFQVATSCSGGVSGYTASQIFSTDCPRVQVKVFLAGAYNTATNIMSTNLLTNGNLPLTQPYNTAPWNYTGTENVASIPNNVTDWVLIELRDAANNNVVIAQRAAFLMSNGNVQDLDGLSGVQFTGLPTGNYYIVVRHRNHLDVMSAAAVNLPSVLTYDFTTSANQALAGQQETVGSAFALYAGDVNGDGIISVYDYNQYVDESANIGYLISDCTLDGNNTVGDFNAYRPNADKIGVRQIRY